MHDILSRIFAKITSQPEKSISLQICYHVQELRNVALICNNIPTDRQIQRGFTNHVKTV